MTAVVSDRSETVALQQRDVRVLALGQVVGGAALAPAVTVGGFHPTGRQPRVPQNLVKALGAFLATAPEQFTDQTHWL